MKEFEKIGCLQKISTVKCRLLYKKEKLNRKQKSYEKPSQNKSANIDDDTLEIPDKQPVRTSIIEKLCFFCGCGKSTVSNLSSAQQSEDDCYRTCRPQTTRKTERRRHGCNRSCIPLEVFKWAVQ